MRAVLGETFRLLGRHLHLFTLLSLTVWLPTHILLNYLEFFDPGEEAAGRAADSLSRSHLVSSEP